MNSFPFGSASLSVYSSHLFIIMWQRHANIQYTRYRTGQEKADYPNITELKITLENYLGNCILKVLQIFILPTFFFFNSKFTRWTHSVKYEACKPVRVVHLCKLPALVWVSLSCGWAPLEVWLFQGRGEASANISVRLLLQKSSHPLQAIKYNSF